MSFNRETLAERHASERAEYEKQRLEDDIILTRVFNSLLDQSRMNPITKQAIMVEADSMGLREVISTEMRSKILLEAAAEEKIKQEALRKAAAEKAAAEKAAAEKAAAEKAAAEKAAAEKAAAEKAAAEKAAAEKAAAEKAAAAEITAVAAVSPRFVPIFPAPILSDTTKKTPERKAVATSPSDQRARQQFLDTKHSQENLDQRVSPYISFGSLSVDNLVKTSEKKLTKARRPEKPAASQTVSSSIKKMFLGAFLFIGGLVAAPFTMGASLAVSFGGIILFVDAATEKAPPPVVPKAPPNSPTSSRRVDNKRVPVVAPKKHGPVVAPNPKGIIAALGNGDSNTNAPSASSGSGVSAVPPIPNRQRASSLPTSSEVTKAYCQSERRAAKESAEKDKQFNRRFEHQKRDNLRVKT